ncbi:MAG: GntR family transcriptional regulator [Eubacteriales bacterium]|nr:GntR family transcriptional regulator [Eubacteriales bacterium]
MKITISANSALAIYEQIVSQIKDAVIKKELAAGEAMPSIRGLAKDLSVSVITTKRAYEELEKEGIIQSVAGKGFYVCDMNREILKEKHTMQLEAHFEQLVSDAKNAGLTLEQIIDLVSVLYNNQ